jgi:predicted nucleic acid-binding protein
MRTTVTLDPDVGDAHLAPLAFERGATLVSFDRDFALFEASAWGARAERRARAA